MYSVDWAKRGDGRHGVHVGVSWSSLRAFSVSDAAFGYV